MCYWTHDYEWGDSQRFPTRMEACRALYRKRLQFRDMATDPKCDVTILIDSPNALQWRHGGKVYTVNVIRRPSSCICPSGVSYRPDVPYREDGSEARYATELAKLHLIHRDMAQRRIA
jgi:hypothetical protein